MTGFERGDAVYVEFTGDVVNEVDDDGYRVKVDGVNGRWYAVVPAATVWADALPAKLNPQRAAAHAIDAGWRVGSLLYGHPITRDESTVECGRKLIITAIGTESVLGITQADGDDKWSAEHMVAFDARKWEEIA